MKQILRYSLLVALALMVNLTANAGKIVFGELGDWKMVSSIQTPSMVVILQ